ncbi:MAG: hypothetical protein ABSC23_19815 [Bryobacteraceae bacterium]|jgi:hypothetical protein
MLLSDVYLDMGQDAFDQLVRGIHIGRLKTYRMYEAFKVRARLVKLNTEALRKATPRFWGRIAAKDDEFAKELAQAVLISHLDLITAVLDFVGAPHENGFFAKDMDAKPYFGEGWENRVYEKFHAAFPDAPLVFYINHLRWELLGAEQPYRPASASVG